MNQYLLGSFFFRLSLLYGAQIWRHSVSVDMLVLWNGLEIRLTFPLIAFWSCFNTEVIFREHLGCDVILAEVHRLVLSEVAYVYIFI